MTDDKVVFVRRSTCKEKAMGSLSVVNHVESRHYLGWISGWMDSHVSNVRTECGPQGSTLKIGNRDFFKIYAARRAAFQKSKS